MPPKPDCKDDKPARDKMAAITVIANPLLQDQKVILFQSGSPTYGLRVSSRELVSGAFAETVGPEDPTSVGRPIAYPGQLASMLYKDFVTVFGVTGDDADNLQIEMLSPVQTPIDLSDYTVNSGAIASCATGNGKQGWLYLITTKNGNPAIGEWEVSASAPDMRYLDCKDFSLTTNLYAVYDKVNNTRWLVYQKTDKTIVVYDAVKKKPFEIGKTATRIVEKTPLAASVIPDNVGKGQQLVVYFVGNENPNKDPQLYSANCKLTPESMSFDKDYEQPAPLQDATDGNIDVQDWAGLSAYVDYVPKSEGDAGRARTLIYCVKTKPKKEAKFNVIEHPFSQIQK